MLFATVFAIATAALAAAQTATSSAATSGPTCAAEAVVQSCLGGLKPRIDGCAGNDYSCLCYAYRDSATCWNNCPGDQRGFGITQQAAQYCLAASQYPSTSTTTSASASATGSGTNSAGATTSAVTTGTTSTRASGAAFATGSTTSSAGGAAAAMATPVVGVFAVVFGAVALL